MRNLTVDTEDSAVRFIFDNQKAEARWAPELLEDLKAFHEVDIMSEVLHALLQELNIQFDLTEDERKHCTEVIVKTLNEQS